MMGIRSHLGRMSAVALLAAAGLVVVTPAEGNALVMSGGATAGVTAPLQCLSLKRDPRLEAGNMVNFVMQITCLQGVPRKSFIYLDIERQTSPGVFVIEPPSVQECYGSDIRTLECVSETPCFGAGAIYFGYGFTAIVDEFNVQYKDKYISPAEYIACAH